MKATALGGMSMLIRSHHVSIGCQFTTEHSRIVEDYQQARRIQIVILGVGKINFCLQPYNNNDDNDDNDMFEPVAKV